MALDEPIAKLTDKMINNLHNPAPVVRESAVKTIRVFQEALATNRKEKPFMQIVSALHTMAESESAPDVYGQVADALQTAAMELLVHWRFEECAHLLATLRRHSREESPIGQKKKQLAAKALHEFSTRGLEVICADLNAPLKDRQNGSQRVLAELGEEAVGPLVEAVKRSVDLRTKQAAVQALRRMGPVVKEALLKQMNVGTPGDVLVKLIPLLEEFADASALPTLTSLLQHPDAPVRRQVAQLLAKVKDPKVQSLLAGLLDDADPEVQTEAVRLIGELKLKLATLEIARRLAAAAPMVQEEMCIALREPGRKARHSGPYRAVRNQEIVLEADRRRAGCRADSRRLGFGPAHAGRLGRQDTGCRRERLQPHGSARRPERALPPRRRSTCRVIRVKYRPCWLLSSSLY